MTQDELDRLSVIMMDQDSRIAYFASSSNHYRIKFDEVRAVLMDDDLSDQGKINKLRSITGAYPLNPNRPSISSLLDALAQSPDQP